MSKTGDMVLWLNSGRARFVTPDVISCLAMLAKQHWEKVYKSKSTDSVSWFQKHALMYLVSMLMMPSWDSVSLKSNTPAWLVMLPPSKFIVTFLPIIGALSDVQLSENNVCCVLSDVNILPWKGCINIAIANIVVICDIYATFFYCFDEQFRLKGYSIAAEFQCGLTEYFVSFNVESHHRSLGYSTPDKVCRAVVGGGAIMVDKYKS